MPAFPPYLPSFWAKCLLLLCLAEEDPEPFERAVQAYWPKRILPLYARIDLDYILRSWDPQETSLEDFIKTRWYNPEAYLGVVELLPLLEKWRLEPKEYLLPMVWAFSQPELSPSEKEERLAALLEERQGPDKGRSLAEIEESLAKIGTPKAALQMLEFYGLLWPRSIIPFHEITPGPKAREPEGEEIDLLGLGKPSTREDPPLNQEDASIKGKKGKDLGWHPVREQYQGRWPYFKKPKQVARWAAKRQLGASFLDIAREEAEDDWDLHTMERHIHRQVQRFLQIVNGEHDPKPNAAPQSGLVEGLGPEEKKLYDWAKEHGPFTLRDLLRKGPKSLRKKEAAQRAISHLQSLGLVEWEGGKYRIRHPTPPDKPDR